jgi:hypothetical protein
MVMVKHTFFTLVAAISLVWSSAGYAFRACDDDNIDVYSAATRYVVGQISYDEATGQANGTETTYNYGNRDFEGFIECHVTYELSGIIEVGSSTFVLDARRTNHSAVCPSEMIDAQYPSETLYVFQMDFKSDGTSKVHLGSSGELFASGDWKDGKTVYQTPEECATASS